MLLCIGLPMWRSGAESVHQWGNPGDVGSIPRSGRSPGGGNGNSLQYSCLEDSMDRAAWWAAVPGVAKGRTRPSPQVCTCRVFRLFWKPGSSSTLARLIPQQSSKGDHPYFKSETCEARSLSNLHGDVQLVGCIVRIWNQVCVTQWSAAFYQSLMHPQRWEWGWISPPECPGHCSLLLMESHWLRRNQWSRSQAIGENVGFSAATSLCGGKALPTQHISPPRRCWPTDRWLCCSLPSRHF